MGERERTAGRGGAEAKDWEERETSVAVTIDGDGCGWAEGGGRMCAGDGEGSDGWMDRWEGAALGTDGPNERINE